MKNCQESENSVGFFGKMVFIMLTAMLFYYSSDFLIKNYVKNETLASENKIKQDEVSLATILESRKNNKENSTTTLAFVGDIMLDRGIEQKVQNKGKGDYNYIFANITDSLKKYNFIFGNLEGPVSDKGLDLHDLYSFRMNPDILPVLQANGLSAVTIANNHIDNWGKPALEDTILRLKSNNIIVTGGGFDSIEAYSPRIATVGDIKVALLSYSEFGQNYEAKMSGSGIAIISEDALRFGIAKAREEADIVVVNFHFGEEYQMKENSYQGKYAHLAVDLGADLVVGHHPHVLQPLEKYKNSYIAYSLGNFIFDQPFSAETMQGGLLEVSINNKMISDVVLRKIQLNQDFQPSLL